VPKQYENLDTAEILETLQASLVSRHTAPSDSDMAGNLQNLPAEVHKFACWGVSDQSNKVLKLLYKLFLLSNSSALPLVCRTLWRVFKQAPPSVTALYLPHRLQSALAYPIMDELVLEQYLRLHPRSRYESIVLLPSRLFKRLNRPKPKQLRTGLPMIYDEDSHPIPFVKALLRLFSNQVNINRPDHYPLRSAVRAGHVPLIRLLLQLGANPLGGPSKDSALQLAVQLRSLSLVKLLIEEGESWLDSGCKRLGEEPGKSAEGGP
jgi:hypothetical protein